MSVLAVDAGTTGVTALVVDERGSVVAKGYQEFPQHFPRAGWVEHTPEEIGRPRWRPPPVLTQVDPAELRAVGITNQRETILLWDRETLGSPRRAIVWQDRRTADICERLRAEGHEGRVTELTGLRLDPYFSGTKLMWLAEHEPHTGRSWRRGGTPSGRWTYLVARMTWAPGTSPTSRTPPARCSWTCRPAVVRRAVLAVRGPPRRPARPGPQLG